MQAIAVVFLYLLASLPFLGLLVGVLRRQSAYSRLFIWGLVLQLIPVGLLYFPFGAAGVLLLAYTLVASHRQNRQFRATGIAHPDVELRWSREYQANLWALGFAVEQKAMAWLFLQVVGRQGFQVLWQWILPLSALMWGGLLCLLWAERRTLARRSAST